MIHKGIYGILPSDIDDDCLISYATAALRGGVATLQLRDKQLDDAHILQRARALRTLTHRFNATLMINDSCSLAIKSAADGVHLGAEDMSDLQQIRTDAGEDFIIGITCRNNTTLAAKALQAGADYVSFGAIFASTSKAEVPVIGLSELAKAREMFPDAFICAIGGIKAEHLPDIRAAGADCAAMIGGLFDAVDIQQQAQTLALVSRWQT